MSVFGIFIGILIILIIYNSRQMIKPLPNLWSMIEKKQKFLQFDSKIPFSQTIFWPYWNQFCDLADDD